MARPPYLGLLKRLSVLLVEDNDDARKQFAQLLGLWLGPVHVAANGREGLRMYQEHSPDLVITDILMPEMDGLTMVEHIKDQNPDAVMIVTTALGEQEHLLRAIDLGVDRYITKPIVSQLLLDAVYKAARAVVHQREVAGVVRLLVDVIDRQRAQVAVFRANRLAHVGRGLLDALGYADALEAEPGAYLAMANGSHNWEDIFHRLLADPGGEHIVELKDAQGQTVSFRLQPTLETEANSAVVYFQRLS